MSKVIVESLVYHLAGKTYESRLVHEPGALGRPGLVSAAVGSLLVVLGTTALAFVGVVLWGVGASLGFPVGMSAASDNPVRAAARVSVVSTIGYVAFLAGPPVIGWLGDHVGVLRSLLVVGVLALIVLPLVGATRAVRPPSGDPA